MISRWSAFAVVALVGCTSLRAQPLPGDASTADRPTSGDAATDGAVPDGEAPCQGICGREAISIHTAALHACAVLADQTVVCWGNNRSGMLGDGTRTDRSVPRQVGVDGPVSTACAGDRHSCAVLGTGQVVCWGSDQYGQLGRDPAAPGDPLRPATVMVASGIPLVGITSIACGSTHTCALDGAGAVWCWGSNARGQLGVPLVDLLPHPPAPVAGVTANEIDAGSFFTCARADGGAPLCWGDNQGSQLGIAADGIPHAEPQAVMLPGTIVQLELGGSFACARNDAGEAWCWGANASSETGGPATPTQLPMQHPFVAGAIGLAAGQDHACAWNDAGALGCWGNAQQGQTGTTPSPVPQAEPTLVLTNVRAADGGAHYGCAIVEGEVQCWGMNRHHALGRGDPAFVAEPQLVPGFTSVDALAVGAGHTCFLEGGQTACCGGNWTGQVGNSDAPRDTSSPARVGPAGTVTAIGAGTLHSCLTSGTELWCWGYDGTGQTGQTPVSPFVTPAPALVSTTFMGLFGLDGGETFTCGRHPDSSVICWGDGTLGQRGDPTRDITANPRLVTDVGGVVSLSAGRRHTCVVTTGSVYCWGDGAAGQTGPGAVGVTVDRPIAVPLPMGAEGTATIVAAGEAHTCAVTLMGTAYCWGAAEDGRLGDGTSTGGRAVPSEVLDVGGVTAISAGEVHTCAIAMGGRVFCWGGNRVGQLGDGTTTTRTTPVEVALPAAATAIGTGFEHTCAIAGGDLYCWGSTEAGRLCDGSPVRDARAAPVANALIP